MKRPTAGRAPAKVAKPADDVSAQLGPGGLSEIATELAGARSDRITSSLEAAVAQARKLVELHADGPSRADARKKFERVAAAAGEVAAALTDPHYGPILGHELRRFSYTKPDTLEAQLRLLANLARNRAGLGSTEPGDFRFTAELGWPTPQLFLATFALLLRERTTGALADRRTPAVWLACEKLAYASRLPAQGGTADPLSRWENHLRDARQHVAAHRQAEHKTPAPGPAPVRQPSRQSATGENAVFLALAILDQAGVPPQP